MSGNPTTPAAMNLRISERWASSAASSLDSSAQLDRAAPEAVTAAISNLHDATAHRRGVFGKVDR
jgi:hypothetical protein